MERLFHETHRERVAQLTEKFCKLIGLEGVELTYDKGHSTYNISYLVPGEFDWTTVVSFMTVTAELMDKAYQPKGNN